MPKPSTLWLNSAGAKQTLVRIVSKVDGVWTSERESLAPPVAFAGTSDVRCDIAAPAITGANLPRNGLENVTSTGRQLETVS